MKRKIIKIEEEKCNGCGACAAACHEGAIEMIDGKAKLTLILNVLRVFAFRVPVLWYFQNFTQLGTEAVGLTMMVSNVCAGLSSLVVAIPVVMQIKKLIREQEAAET